MIHEHPLPECFKDTPGLSSAMQEMRRVILQNLKEESEGSMLDLLLMERVSYLYAHIRFKENTTGFANDKAYKEVTQLLLTMIDSLRKKAMRDAAQEDVKAEVLAQVAGAMKEAVDFLPAPQRSAALQNLADLLEG